jgi:membrane protein insertase Oxa1/YidC/SpoIIIJ
MGEVRRNKKRDWVSEVKGIMVSIFLFLILFLFVFNWVPLGLFIYIFYGSIKALPLMVLV